jgi:plastocyanin
MRKVLAVGCVLALAAAALAVPALGATRSIALRDNFFSPKSTTVSKGTTVKWVWRGKVAHNVTVRSGPVKFHSRTQTTGSFSKRLTKAGTYRIVCTIHPGMNLTLKVK